MGSGHQMSWSANFAGRDSIQWMKMLAARWDGPRDRGGRERSEFWGVQGDRPFRPVFPPGPRARSGDPRTWAGQFWRGSKVRRGGVRAAVLVSLAEEPRNGYQIIQRITERSGGGWRPSAGSVYPALQQLEDEGLVRALMSGTRRLFELTEKGRTYVEIHADELGALWESVSGTMSEYGIDIREMLEQVVMAAFQVLQAGSESQADEVRRVLVDARRSLYQILVGEESESADGTEEDMQ